MSECNTKYLEHELVLPALVCKSTLLDPLQRGEFADLASLVRLDPHPRHPFDVKTVHPGIGSKRLFWHHVDRPLQPKSSPSPKVGTPSHKDGYLSRVSGSEYRVNESLLLRLVLPSLNSSVDAPTRVCFAGG